MRWKRLAEGVKKYRVVCRKGEEIVQQLRTTDNTITVSNLEPGMCYILEASALFVDGNISDPASVRAYTGDRKTFQIM